MKSALSKYFGRNRHYLFIAGGVLLGILLRVWAGVLLPVDFDEPVYLKAGGDYAALIRAGDLKGIFQYSGNSEHPPLVKLLYSLPYLINDDTATTPAVFYGARAISVFFGSLSVLLLGLINPLAGVFLGVDTLAIKYTSQAYLEALPQLMSLAAVLAFIRYKKFGDRWFWFSALFLGLTAASKYSYLPVTGVILYLAIWEKKIRWQDVVLYFSVALMTFWVCDPYLWRDPGNRLFDSLIFHAQYTQSAQVQQVNYPWYQPLAWISQTVPWHPQVFFFGIDEIIFLLGVVGLYWEWRERRWNAIWFLFGLLILLLWPTKWPQYAVLIVPPLCLSAAGMLQRGLRFIKTADNYWDWLKIMSIRPSRGWLIAVGIFALILVGGKIGYEIYGVFIRQGWSFVSAEVSLLPSNTVYDIALGDGRQIVLATEQGVAFYTPAEKKGVADDWAIYNKDNSGLPDNRIMAILRDRDGVWWFGTDNGLASYQGGTWHTFSNVDLGLDEANVRAIGQGEDGRIWAGTLSGLAVYDGRQWKVYTTANSGLMDNNILSQVVEHGSTGDIIWVGTLVGISRLNTVTDQWMSFTSDNAGIGWGGISDLMIDSKGLLWASSLGGGVSTWDGQTWQPYRVSNSDIPLNTVSEIVETEPGAYWMGVAFPSESGGVLVRLHGGVWKKYTSENSGYPGAEALVIIRDRSGRLLVGTRTEGLVIYSGQ